MSVRVYFCTSDLLLTLECLLENLIDHVSDTHVPDKTKFFITNSFKIIAIKNIVTKRKGDIFVANDDFKYSAKLGDAIDMGDEKQLCFKDKDVAISYYVLNSKYNSDYTGQLTEYYSDGILKQEYSVRRGTLHGPYCIFSHDSFNRIIECGSYRNGKIANVVKTKNGLQTIRNVKIDGKEYKESLMWGSKKDNNNNTIGTIRIKNNEKLVRIYNEDGNITETYKLINEKKEGLNHIWYEDNKLYAEQNYTNGKLNGLCKKWHENGQQELVCNYVNGKLNGLYKSWHPNGACNVVSNYDDNFLNGLYEVWYNNGQKNMVCNYSYGKLNGLYREWYKNNILKIKSEYTNGDLDGLYQKWNDNGDLLEEKSYGFWQGGHDSQKMNKKYKQSRGRF